MSDRNDSTLENFDGQNLADGLVTEDDFDDQDLEQSTQPDDNDESQGEGSGSAPDNEDKQDAVQKAINRKHFQAMEAQRKYEEEKARREELEAKLQERQAPKPPPEIPPLPNPYDTDYDQKMVERDKILKDHAAYQYQQHILKRQKEYQQQQVQTQQQQQVQELVTKFQENASKLNIPKEQFAESDKIVGAYLNSPQTAEYLLKNDNGPLIVDYLANNVQEFDKINKLGGVDQVVHIVTEVLPKAIKGKKKTKAPDPIDNAHTSGRTRKPGSGSYGDNVVRGATFE